MAEETPLILGPPRAPPLRRSRAAVLMLLSFALALLLVGSGLASLLYPEHPVMQWQPASIRAFQLSTDPNVPGLLLLFSITFQIQNPNIVVPLVPHNMSATVSYNSQPFVPTINVNLSRVGPGKTRQFVALLQLSSLPGALVDQMVSEVEASSYVSMLLHCKVRWSYLLSSMPMEFKTPLILLPTRFSINTTAVSD